MKLRRPTIFIPGYVKTLVGRAVTWRYKIVCTGCERAGKTTVNDFLRGGNAAVRLLVDVPTISTTEETDYEYNPRLGVTLAGTDVPGQSEFESNQLALAKSADGIIHIVDSRNQEHFERSRDLLRVLIAENPYKTVVVAFNKTDEEEDARPSNALYLINYFELDQVNAPPYYFVSASQGTNMEKLANGVVERMKAQPWVF